MATADIYTNVHTLALHYALPIAILSNIETQAESMAVLTLPHLSTTESTSGIALTRLSSKRITFMISSTPVWDILLGMGRKEPSSRAGINSFPTPGKVPARDVQAPVSRRLDRKSTRLNSSH